MNGKLFLIKLIEIAMGLQIIMSISLLTSFIKYVFPNDISY